MEHLANNHPLMDLISTDDDKSFRAEKRMGLRWAILHDQLRGSIDRVADLLEEMLEIHHSGKERVIISLFLDPEQRN